MVPFGTINEYPNGTGRNYWRSALNSAAYANGRFQMLGLYRKKPENGGTSPRKTENLEIETRLA
jgi:hypothetical protein